MKPPVGRFLRFQSSASPLVHFQVASLVGDEGLNKPFRFDLELVQPRQSEAPDLDALLRQPATLTLDRGDGLIRQIPGVVSEVADLATGIVWRHWRLSLVSPLWPLGLGRQSRVFRERKVPDLVADILAAHPSTRGLRVRRELHGRYAERPYTVQWQESDLALIDRLLEHEGIAWFHADDGSLVLADHPDAFPRLDRPLPLRPQAEGGVPTVDPQREPVVESLVRRRRLACHLATVDDWNWRQPDQALERSARIGDDPVSDHRDWGSHHGDGDAGTRYARIRAEELRAAREAGDGQADHPGFAAGRVIRLAHGGDWLLTGVHHEAVQRLDLGAGDASSTTYRCRFACHDAAQPWRPPRRTPRPAIPGVINARIDAIAGGPYAEPDADGCYRVQLALDRSGRGHGDASRPVRCASPSSGEDHGFHIPLHQGSEVLLYHINGDPDRPVIAGCVPDAANPPVVNDDNRAQSRWLSAGGNELVFDDTVAAQRILLRAAKDRRAEIAHNDELAVQGNRTEAITGSLNRSVGGDQGVTVSRNSTETVTVAKAVTIGAGFQISIGGAMNETVAGAKAEQVGGVKSEAVAGSRSLEVGADLTVTIKGDHSETDGGSHQVKAKKIQFTASDELAINVGQASLTLKKNGEIVLKGTKITVDGSSKVVVKGGKIAGN